MKEQYPRFSVFKKKVAQRMRDLVFGTRKKKKPHTSKNDSIDPSVFLSEMPYRGQAGASPYSGVAIRKEQKQKQTPPSLRGVFDEAIQKEQKTHLRQDSGMAKQGNFLPPLSHEDVTAPLGQGSRRKERTDGIVRIFTSLRFWKWDYARFFKTTIWCIRHPKQTWQALRVDIFRKVRDIERKLKSFIRWCFATLPRRIVASVLIALIVVLPVSNLFFVHQASAAWWNDSWLYRKSITVTNNTTAQTNVYIAFTLDTSDTTKFQNDCGDLRFTDANGNLQDYFIVSGCATANTVIHVNLQTFLSGSQSLFSYYGNPTVQNGFVNADFPTQASNYTIGTTGTEEKGPGPIAYWAFDEGTGTVAKNALNNSAGTGGTITYVNGFVIHTFTTVGNSTFVPPARVSSVEVLVVGGGGIGGANLSYTNGGGAGGGVVYHPTKAVPGGSPIPLTVGAGGSSSSFSDIVAVAGGNANVVGKNGGSTTQSNSGGGTGYGNAGGAGANATGGGGGGAGGAGSNGYSGTGGPGKAFDISGTSVYYAGGGGGCGTVYVGTGGVGGGGNCAGSASPNTGGGSGGYRTGSGGPGASGSGIVIVRYPIVSDGILTNMSSPATATSGWQTEDQCVSGKCLAFDGTDDYVNEPTSISNVQSLSFWARPATTTQSILQLSSSVSVSATGGTVSATGFTSPTIYVNGKTSSPITANTWNHIEITTGTPITADAIKFGVVNTTYFNGKIDEPKLYPYARTKAQAGQDYAAGLASADANSGTSASFGDGSDKWMSDGLVGYWKMDESSWNGTTGEVIDASGNGNNGTATGITGTSTGGNSTTTVCDTGKAWTVNALAYDTITLTSGTYSGQTRTVSSNTATCVTVSSAFGGVPSTDGYRLTPSTVGGKYGSGGSFDGTGGYIKTNQGTLQGAATFSMWVKSSKSGDQVFMSMGDSGWSNTIGIMNYGGNLAFFGSSTFTILDAVSKIVDGKWHHVVITQSASSNAIITSYIDGVFGTRVTGQSGILSVNKYNYIGNRFDNMVPTSGFIDETRIYNRALSPAEVRKLYDWAPGPVGYWKMDENTGNTVADSSGNNNNGTWTDTGSHWAVGKIGGAGKFRNSANWITVPNSPSLNIPSSNLTISAWMYTKSWGGTNRGTVLGKPGYNYYLRLDGGGNKSILYSSSATGDAAGPVYNFFTGSEQLLNVWHHVEISRGGGYGKFYVDGVLVSSTALSDMALPVNSGPLCIGALLSGGTYAFDGLLDDVKLYNYARSQEQVLQDMTGEDASSNYQSSKEATVYYKFDEGNGTTANNSGVGGSALNGTLTNMASPATSTSGWTDNGKYGKGLNFDGVNDSVNEPTSIANAQAVSFWAKPTSTTQSFLQLASGISVSATSGTVSATGFTSPTIYVNGKPNGAVTAGIWNHILVETATPISANAIKLGLVGSTYYSGALDDVRIYNYALTKEQIANVMNNSASVAFGNSDPCGGVSSVSDADGNPYGTVAVGTQCWMASNMMTTRYPDGTAITRGPTSATWNGNDNGYYAYPPNTSNNAEETLANIKSGRLGFLYQWSAVMYGSTTPGAQGICPSGWHVPTDAEQYTLENFLKDPGQTCSASRNGDDCRDAGAKMIFGGSSGLNFPLDGFRDYNGIFFGRGGNTFFASSQKSGSTAAVARHFFGSATVNRHIDTNPYGFSVRCLKNNP
ncbi:MAG: LamG-like jellyroll fold domain-containing protein [Candidatus Moraniibacteriota bacterium]